MGTGSVKKLPVINPYVGPRPFSREEATRFFGRDNEARDLLSLVVSEQLVLFYAQSGAGKSSLVNTRLVPGLEERKFEVLPVGRVSGEVLKHEECDNIFVFNLLINLDQSKTAPERFARMRLGDFLANLFNTGEKFIYGDSSALPQAAVEEAGEAPQVLPRALILDQFEEIITTHPEAWEKRSDFFLQLAEAMEQDPYLWVVLVMREDYVAALDPFAHILPNQLRARFYMRRMGYDSALDAVRKPVERMRPFDTGIAETLVDNLRLVSGTMGQTGQLAPVYGEFIEPVQLQVVCYQLWSNLMKEVDTLAPGKRITQADIDGLAKGENLAQFINKALADFYEQALAKVLQKLPGRVTEHDLRNWFSTQLITEAETRGFVYQGKNHTAGLPNEAVTVLASQYIIRPETRPGGTWFELVHDRFVGPILQSNRRWLVSHQSRLLTDAKNWLEAGRPVTMLYEGNQLEKAQAEIEKGGDVITELEKKFVEESSRIAKNRRDFRLRLILAGALTLLLILSGLTTWALSSRAAAFVALTEARAANVTANWAKDDAIAQNATANAANTQIIESQLTQSARAIDIQVQMAARLESLGGSNTPMPGESYTPTPIPTYTPYYVGVDSPTPDLSIPTNTPEPTPTPTASPTLTQQASIRAYRQEVIGKSVKGQDIIVHQFGNGPRHIVLVGGLHAGFAPSTVSMANAMYDLLSADSSIVPAALTVDIIPIANPDSYPLAADYSGKYEGRLNANGVDLNRNWDCEWQSVAKWQSRDISGGTAPFSEPETGALRDFILKNFTVAVITWEARSPTGMVTPGGCGGVSVFSDPLSQLYASWAGYTAQPFEAYAINGDMTNWLDGKGIGAVSVFLRSYTDLKNDEIDNNYKALLGVLESYGR
jgi:hypothetical protein